MVNKVKFEREHVIHVASQLFWQKGFHATSIRDLQDAVNMRPGSIYAAFGSKEGLYSESLKEYTVQMQSQIDGFLNGADSILAALRALVESIIGNRQCFPSAICMLVKANSEFTEKDANLRELSFKQTDKFEQYLCVLFNQAIKNDELINKRPAIEYARFFQVQLTGLRCYFNRPEADQLAEPMIEQMFTLLKNI